MNVATFLMDLRALLSPTDAWHPLACANKRGRVLGEFEQGTPASMTMICTERQPVRWNLPCAVTFLLLEWERAGRFPDVALDRQAMRVAAGTALDRAAVALGWPVDLWCITRHADALAVIDTALAGYVQPMATTTLPAEFPVGPSLSAAVGGRVVAA